MGMPFQFFDLADANADISAYLVKGTNVVEAVVATTRYNALAPIWFTLQTAGQGPMIPPLTPLQEAGLVGTVVITLYVNVSI